MGSVLPPSASFAGFSYSPLAKSASFRLLRILPCKNESEDLTCDLDEYELSSCPQYVALSYCWGISQQTETCSVNLRPFKTTKSLAALLRQIRKDGHREEAFIWADAICIDQENIQEKATQIKHMPRIYAKATKVISWLSRGEGERKSLLNIQQFLDAGCAFPDDKDIVYTVYLSLMRAFVSLAQLDYWRRCWIVQEVCLAKDIQLVALAARVSWDGFFQALKAHTGSPDSKHWKIQGKLHEYMTTHTGHLRELDALRGRILLQEPMPLLQALYWTRRCEATLVKDKIFALLGLVTDSWLPLQSLDYSDSLEETERKITLTEMTDIEPSAAVTGTPFRLDLITFAPWAVSSYNAGSPRWSPSWTDSNVWHRLRRWQRLRLDWVLLRLQSTMPLTDRPLQGDHGCLLADGYSLGSILHWNSGSGTSAYRRLPVLYAAVKSVLDQLHPSDRKGDIHWQPQLRNGSIENFQPWKADLERYRTRLKQMLEHLSSLISHEHQNPPDPIHAETLVATDKALYVEYCRQLQEILTLASSMEEPSSTIWTFRRLRFYHTSQGFMGFGLFHAVPGDLVYLVEGMSVPVILRRYGSGLSSRGFIVVGEMFAPGVLQGEYFAAPERRPLLNHGLAISAREKLHIL